MIRALALAAVVATGAGAAGASTIIVNGDFETVDGRTGVVAGNSQGDRLNSLASGTRSRSWDVYASLPGEWYNYNNRGTGIEVQTNNTLSGIDAHSGQHYIELDSENAGDGFSNSNLAQDIFLVAGDYQLSFWYAPRPGLKNSGSNTIGTSIITDILEEFQITPNNMSGVTENGWTQIVRDFTVTESTEATLLFRALGRQDELGGLIDTVSISSVPLPAGALLMLSGLAGFGVMRRRQKT